MGRSLQNTMINLGIQGACDEAMYQASQIISSTNFSIDFYLRMRKENKESRIIPYNRSHPYRRLV